MAAVPLDLASAPRLMVGQQLLSWVSSCPVWAAEPGGLAGMEATCWAASAPFLRRCRTRGLHANSETRRVLLDTRATAWLPAANAARAASRSIRGCVGHTPRSTVLDGSGYHPGGRRGRGDPAFGGSRSTPPSDRCPEQPLLVQGRKARMGPPAAWVCSATACPRRGHNVTVDLDSWDGKLACSWPVVAPR